MKKPQNIFPYLETTEFSAQNGGVLKKIHAANEEQLIFKDFQKKAPLKTAP